MLSNIELDVLYTRTSNVNYFREARVNVYHNVQPMRAHEILQFQRDCRKSSLVRRFSIVVKPAYDILEP
jgi:hypothetical protein